MRELDILEYNIALHQPLTIACVDTMSLDCQTYDVWLSPYYHTRIDNHGETVQTYLCRIYLTLIGHANMVYLLSEHFFAYRRSAIRPERIQPILCAVMEVCLPLKQHFSTSVPSCLRHTLASSYL